MAKSVSIGGREVGPGQVPFVIAEIGANHNGDMRLCEKLVEAAANAGADAAKFQSWSDTSLISETQYKKVNGLREQLQKYQLTPSQHERASAICRDYGIMFCSTPFAMEEADMLERLDVPFFKIASAEVTYSAFLRHVALKGRPIVLSTGMADLGEIERAIKTIREAGNDQLVLLHCVSLYPPDFRNVNLNNIRMLAETFDVPVGFSDHTIGVACPLAAVALGACIIEKHFTLDKALEGWDHAVSADPGELATIISEGRNIHEAMGAYCRVVGPAEREMRAGFRRSLVTRRAMKAGDVIAEGDLGVKRPGTGISPDESVYVVGRRLARDVGVDELLMRSDLQ